MPFARIILPLPIPRPFTYRIPDGMDAKVGCRALVPFGSRRLSGVIVALSESSEQLDEVKDVLEMLDEEPSFTDELLELTRWIADYYVCTWGEVVRAVLPAGSASGGGQVGVKTEKHVRFAGSYRHGGAIDELHETLRGPKQKAVIESLAGYRAEGLREPRLADVLARADASTSTVNSLLQRGIVEIVEKEVLRIPLSDGHHKGAPPADHVLSPAQESALEHIKEAVDADRFETFLLHGVTGSGKTEVYIRALKRALEKGGTGIVLVPEIALTPQTVRRFRCHFGDRVAVFHSRMSPGERFDAWRGLRDGLFDVVIGPRSAVLAPLRNIGIIIVDEEHEQSYKQHDPAPRYHARDVAIVRARMNDAVCVLGSATPSLETFYNARGGKYTLLELPDRAPVVRGEPAILPDVRIIDMRGVPGDAVLSPYLEKAIRERLDRGEQTIILQNRRGYAPLLTCASCGWAPECPDCAVTMTVHKSRRILRCHYCGRTARIPSTCPSCGQNALELLGTGTQKVEETLQALFPSARVLRMDLDTTSGKDAHATLLKRFGDRKADILLGTQMVAKGLDFEGVTLVGVVNADTGLLLPDFRAEERTFQLLAQVAGRAGRASLPGEVIIQTRNPGRPVIRYARDHDYEAFARAQLAERQIAGYPPFGRLAGIEFKGPRERDVADLARRWTGILAQRAGPIEILGPEPAFISRVKKQYRYHTIVKAPRDVRAGVLQEVLARVEEAAGSPPARCRVNIDIDPMGLF